MAIKLKADNPFLSGLDPELISFESQADMVSAMSDPRYKINPDFRDVVSKMLENGMRNEAANPTTAPQGFVSGRDLNRAMADVPALKKVEDMEIFKEQTLKLFGDERYKTSPTYRREVKEWLRANDPELNGIMPAGALIDRNDPKYQPQRVQLGADGVDHYSNIKESIRQGKIAAAQARAEEAKAEVDQHTADEIEELGPDRR